MQSAIHCVSVVVASIELNVSVLVGLVSLFNGISTSVGYLMPKLFVLEEH